jgi:hypothetical protein
MNWFVALILLASLSPLTAASQARAAEDPFADDLAAVETVVGDYLKAGKTGDIQLFRRAFHPSARLQFVQGGDYREWSLEEYLGGRTAGKRSNHRVRILSIDFAGTSAAAKVELDYGHRRFVDFLSLLKIDGQWRIVNKVFYRAEG